MSRQINEIGPTCVKPHRLSHHACLRDAQFGRYAIRRKNIKSKKLLSLHISHMHGGDPIQPVAMEVCTYTRCRTS
jgi:hypothetical protein